MLHLSKPNYYINISEGKELFMAKILRGKEVADALTAQMQQDTQALKEAGVTPTLCILRVGERPDDLAY